MDKKKHEDHEHIFAIISHHPKSHKVEVFFLLKIKPKNRLYHFYPFAKVRREKINELQAMTFDEESANDAHTAVAHPKHQFIGFTPKISFDENFAQKDFGRRKMKCWESSETRFGQVSCRSEPCSGGKRPFEVSKKKIEFAQVGKKKLEHIF